MMLLCFAEHYSTPDFLVSVLWCSNSWLKKHHQSPTLTWQNHVQLLWLDIMLVMRAQLRVLLLQPLQRQPLGLLLLLPASGTCDGDDDCHDDYDDDDNFFFFYYYY